MGEEADRIAQAKLYQAKVDYIGLVARQTVQAALGTYILLLIMFGLFISCSLSVGWEVGQRIAEGVGIK